MTFFECFRQGKEVFLPRGRDTRFAGVIIRGAQSHHGGARRTGGVGSRSLVCAHLGSEIIHERVGCSCCCFEGLCKGSGALEWRVACEWRVK
jgi:hypothetical protein